MTRKQILVVWSGPEHGTSANLFKALAEVLAMTHKVVTGPNTTVPGSRFKKILNHILCDLRRWPKLWKSDAVILHSYAALSVPTVILAWLLRRRIIIVLWDTYPITIDGQTLGGGFRKAFDRIEHLCVRLADRVVVPTEDFLPFVRHHDLRLLPLWPSLPLGASGPSKDRAANGVVKLAFVGQAGLTRGLPQAIDRLGQQAETAFELHIFSPKPPDADLQGRAKNVRVVARGFLDRAALIAALDEMHFGLISLHPGMGQPGFPSKVFDYAAAGLPVVYTGRPLPAFGALLRQTGMGFTLDDAHIDWNAETSRSAASIDEAVRRFADATVLTPDRLERALF